MIGTLMKLGFKLTTYMTALLFKLIIIPYKLIYKYTPFNKIWVKILENFGVVFGLISVFLLLSSITFIGSNILLSISSALPFLTMAGFFALKTIGFYRMDILDGAKRRDIKKALIALTAIQLFILINITPLGSLICLLAIPLSILEWYPKKSFNYIKAKTDKTKTLRVFVQS